MQPSQKSRVVGASVLYQCCPTTLSLLTAPWIWETCDTHTFLFSFFSLLYLTHTTPKSRVSIQTHLVLAGWDCVRRYGVHHQAPAEVRVVDTWQESRRGSDTIQLIMSIWVWGTSTKECRAVTSTMFYTMSWGETELRLWWHAQGVELKSNYKHLFPYNTSYKV